MTDFYSLTLIAIIFYVAFKFLVKKRNLINCLPNKVVLITGASSGIGEQLAHVFYTAGCRLILCARRKDELERVRKELLQLYSTSVTHPPVVLTMDLTDMESIKKQAQQALDIHGHIDILINNGGISFFGEVTKTQFAADMNVMMTNYFGTVELTKTILPSMRKRKSGKIVCISSVLGKLSVPYRSPYCASKHALEAFCNALRAEVYDDNVKVTIISPGYVATKVAYNSVTSSGEKFNKEDPFVEKGVEASEMAKDILRAVLNDEKDVMICELYIRLAYWCKIFFPRLFYLILIKRARDFAHEK
ncbi:hypothetical protein PVAND_003506 [Polypedilum vanderplanki]|uniref:Dehydrogenase/reductase SDR family protein 7-like n=1 Tax=Polypedilum vanderplanki TaxID=319348 RepID=A0A9J6BVB0_POLVA|nr:hypothetical protein PVAND_003506 [Polypedilum vanderplanki]